MVYRRQNGSALRSTGITTDVIDRGVRARNDEHVMSNDECKSIHSIDVCKLNTYFLLPNLGM